MNPSPEEDSFRSRNIFKPIGCLQLKVSTTERGLPAATMDTPATSRDEKRVINLEWFNLREARRPLPYKRCLPLTTLCVDDEEGATKVFSSSLAGIVHSFVHSRLTQSFPLKFTDLLERSTADRYRQSHIVFSFKTARMCPTGSIPMLCMVLKCQLFSVFYFWFISCSFYCYFFLVIYF